MSGPDCASGSLTAALRCVVWHALLWLALGNAIGVMIAVLLLWPGLNAYLGEWTYGRWMMVHMNTALYGWCGLPMLGFLFRVYGAERGPLAAWCRPVVWLWSGALVIGSAYWLQGHSSGKLFLDWTGYPRIFLALSMFALWILLATALYRRMRSSPAAPKRVYAAKVLGLLILLAVPFAVYAASSPDVYPVFNPDTGGPTGASQLESSLGIVAILLVLPFGIARRKAQTSRSVVFSWLLFGAEVLLCISIGRGIESHHQRTQYFALASVLVWMLLVPAYYRAFTWNSAAARWRKAMFWWWGGLVVTGWVLFLPGVLDRMKFTDGLVGHSLAAVAGFLSALLIFVMQQLLGEEGEAIFNRSWSFYAWNVGVLAYVVVMTIAGWIEGTEPGFNMAPGTARNVLYFLRLLTGIAMLVASLDWLVGAARAPAGSHKREPVAELQEVAI